MTRRRIFELSDNRIIEVDLHRPSDDAVSIRQLAGPPMGDDQWEAFVKRLSIAYKAAGNSLKGVDLT